MGWISCFSFLYIPYIEPRNRARRLWARFLTFRFDLQAMRLSSCARPDGSRTGIPPHRQRPSIPSLNSGIVPAGDGTPREFVVLLHPFDVLPHQMQYSLVNSRKMTFAIVANHSEIVDVLSVTYIPSGIVFFSLHPMHILCYVQSGRNDSRTSQPRVLRAAALSHEGVRRVQRGLGGRLASPWSFWSRGRRKEHFAQIEIRPMQQAGFHNPPPEKNPESIVKDSPYFRIISS